jgi:hypothetical protein
LHFRNGVSEIDDAKFFLSKNGKTDLKAELLASVSQLIKDRSDTEKSMQCYYPSRSLWIIEQFPELKKVIKTPKCESLNKELETLSAKRVTLILASAHINSPASAFGHTFLRIDASKDTPLASYSVNYAAQTTETNGLIYAYQGIFGGYKGLYSIVPYSKQLETYSDLEQRDVWEYPLNLSPDEIKRLVYHILEIRHFHADYYFASENCSYNLLWLLEVARNSTHLVHQFSFKAIPIDTLRAILKAEMVDEVIYRPSKRTKLLAKSKALADPLALNFAKSNRYNFEALSGLSTSDKANALELATHLLQIKYTKNKIKKKKYLSDFLRLLKERSKLGVIDEVKIPRPVEPQLSHKSNKVSFSIDSKNRIGVRFKVAYHDIYDNESGFIPGSYINFFDVSLKHDENKLKLDELNLLDIRSYALQDPVFKPISWQVALGGKRTLKNKLTPYFQAGAGLTLGSKTLFSYANLAPTLYFGPQSNQSLAINTGVIYNARFDLKLGLLAKKEWLTTGEESVDVEPFVTYDLTKNTALNFSYKYKNTFGEKINNTAQLSLFWYY